MNNSISTIINFIHRNNIFREIICYTSICSKCFIFNFFYVFTFLQFKTFEYSRNFFIFSKIFDYITIAMRIKDNLYIILILYYSQTIAGSLLSNIFPLSVKFNGVLPVLSYIRLLLAYY